VDVPAATAAMPLPSQAGASDAGSGPPSTAAAAAGGAGQAPCSAADAVAAAGEVLRQAQVFVVPCMCPDGVARWVVGGVAVGSTAHESCTSQTTILDITSRFLLTYSIHTHPHTTCCSLRLTGTLTPSTHTLLFPTPCCIPVLPSTQGSPTHECHRCQPQP
jgi:hypothetical protein